MSVRLLGGGGPALAICFPLQAKVWFEYDVVFNSKGEQVNVPKGCLCGDCGRAGEGWPDLSPVQIQEKLSVDPTFQVLWEYVLKRIRGEVDFSGHEFVVRRVEDVGMRAEWPAGFIDMATFVGHKDIGIDPTKVKLRVGALTDPDGNTRAGVVLRLEDSFENNGCDGPVRFD